MKKNMLKTSVASIAILMAMPLAFAQEGEYEEIEEIVVTGSRMLGGSETVKVIFMTAEDIKMRGLSSITDIIRSIPQNYNGLTRYSGVEDAGAGVQSVNLQGIGSGSTLVLVNGRRIAGAAGDQRGFANISNIPASAIERVEIRLGGGAAIYGADAIGGVVNFILKKNFIGLSANVRHEVSSTGADRTVASLYGGYGWDTGIISGTVSYEKELPVINSKTGFTTRDFRHLYNANRDKLFADGFGSKRYDLRRRGYLTGFVFNDIDGRMRDGGRLLPNDHDGVDAEADDFEDSDREAKLQGVNKFAGSEVATKSMTLNLEQQLTERLKFRGDFLYSVADSRGERLASAQNFIVPASNAYNPFGEDVKVNYAPRREQREGVLMPNVFKAKTENISFNVGFDYEINDDTVIKATYGRSQQSNSSSFQRFRSYNNKSLLKRASAEVKKCWANAENILANSDPKKTVNLFGNGSAQTALIKNFSCLEKFADNRSVTSLFDAYVSGLLFDLPGGAVRYVVGGEIRNESLGNNEKSKVFSSIGTSPKRAEKAIFAELSVPIIGYDNAKSWAQGLILDIQGRYDRYDMSGGVGFENDKPIIKAVDYAAFSPQIGIAWYPTDELKIRASWARSFRSPLFTQLFSVTRGMEIEENFEVYDPLAPGGADWVETRAVERGNPDLRPERGSHYDIGFKWQPEWISGLMLAVDYSRLNFKDRIVTSEELEELIPSAQYVALKQVFDRDAAGNITLYKERAFNLASRISETLNVRLLYEIETDDYGTFIPEINWNKVLKLHDKVTEKNKSVNLVGTQRGLDRYQLNGALRWWKDNLNAELNINHRPGYDNNNGVFGDEDGKRIGFWGNVDSYTTIDLTVSYEFDNGIRVRAGGRNILGADFPLAVTSDPRPYDTTRVNLRGQVLFLDLTFEM
jgi:iron complex outermembrane receptor protein